MTHEDEIKTILFSSDDKEVAEAQNKLVQYSVEETEKTRSIKARLRRVFESFNEEDRARFQQKPDYANDGIEMCADVYIYTMNRGVLTNGSLWERPGRLSIFINPYACDAFISTVDYNGFCSVIDVNAREGILYENRVVWFFRPNEIAAAKAFLEHKRKVLADQEKKYLRAKECVEKLEAIALKSSIDIRKEIEG